MAGTNPQPLHGTCTWTKVGVNWVLTDNCETGHHCSGNKLQKSLGQQTLNDADFNTFVASHGIATPVSSQAITINCT